MAFIGMKYSSARKTTNNTFRMVGVYNYIPILQESFWKILFVQLNTFFLKFLAYNFANIFSTLNGQTQKIGQYFQKSIQILEVVLDT